MTNQRRRFIIVGGIVVVVVILMLAFFGAGNTVRAMSVAEAAAPEAHGQNVEVTGNVVNNSFTIEGDVLTFAISDPDDPSVDLWVRYDKGVAATFGNGVTAICTGHINEDGLLECTELVTKCPSKYETATDALGVARLLGYGDAILDKTVKVRGQIGEGTLTDAGADVRMYLYTPDEEDATEPLPSIPVEYKGALSDEVTEDASLVLTGNLMADSSQDGGVIFRATEVALEEQE